MPSWQWPSEDTPTSYRDRKGCQLRRFHRLSGSVDANPERRPGLGQGLTIPIAYLAERLYGQGSSLGGQMDPRVQGSSQKRDHQPAR